MNPEYDEVLSEEAEKKFLSVSSLLNQIIRRYVLFTRFNERPSAIVLPYNVFDALIDHISDEDLAEIGKKTGATVIEENILQRGKPSNFDTITWLLETIYDSYNNWFNFTRSTINGEERIHFTHQLNTKWSQFLGSCMESVFKSILDINPKIEIRSNSVTVYLPKQSSLNRILKTQT